jgi:hypothetical protein
MMCLTTATSSSSIPCIFLSSSVRTTFKDTSQCIRRRLVERDSDTRLVLNFFGSEGMVQVSAPCLGMGCSCDNPWGLQTSTGVLRIEEWLVLNRNWGASPLFLILHPLVAFSVRSMPLRSPLPVSLCYGSVARSGDRISVCAYASCIAASRPSSKVSYGGLCRPSAPCQLCIPWLPGRSLCTSPRGAFLRTCLCSLLAGPPLVAPAYDNHYAQLDSFCSGLPCAARVPAS